jgi:hypothetical protein
VYTGGAQRTAGATARAWGSGSEGDERHLSVHNSLAALTVLLALGARHEWRRAQAVES